MELNLLTLEEVITRFQVDQKTIYNWRKYKGLPSVKIGRNVYFREEALKEWLIQMENKEALTEKEGVGK